MAHTTVNSGFWAGGLQENTPLDGANGHGARLRKAVAPEPVHVQDNKPSEVPVRASESDSKTRKGSAGTTPKTGKTKPAKSLTESHVKS